MTVSSANSRRQNSNASLERLLLSSLETRIQKKARRESSSQAASRLDLASHLFPKQDAFGLSKARQRTACCSRRAGKSEACAAVLLSSALQKKASVSLYITKTRLGAKRIIWGVLRRVNAKYGLGGVASQGELSMSMPNGSIIYLVGANNRDEIEKFRGLPIAMVVIDEAQVLGDYLLELVDEVLEPALMDHDGSLVLVGTPGPVPTGYFYECHQGALSGSWEHYEWTFFDNPWIQTKSGKSPQEHLESALKRRGVTVDNPAIQREYFGKWVYDAQALVFAYDAKRNDYDELPDKSRGWETVIGVDLGFDDSDALSVLGWTPKSPDCYLEEEWVGPKQTITQLGERLNALVVKYGPQAVVIDTGGLGKKIAAELTARWGLKVEAAEKEQKLAHIELLNDAMRTGHFRAKRGSRFAQDCLLVEWDRSNPEKPKISSRYHSDSADSALYAYVRARHWLYEPETLAPPRPGTAEWHAAIQAKLAAQAQAQENEWLREAEERAQTMREEARDEEFL